MQLTYASRGTKLNSLVVDYYGVLSPTEHAKVLLELRQANPVLGDSDVVPNDSTLLLPRPTKRRDTSSPIDVLLVPAVTELLDGFRQFEVELKARTNARKGELEAMLKMDALGDNLRGRLKDASSALKDPEQELTTFKGVITPLEEALRRLQGNER